MRDAMSSRWVGACDERSPQYNQVALAIALALAAWFVLVMMMVLLL
jgi:hypothetical protein